MGKTEVLMFRLQTTDRDRVREEAREAGITFSELARRRILGGNNRVGEAPVDRVADQGAAARLRD